MHRNAPQAPAIDAVAISTFCEVVFGYLDGFVPVRLLAESGTPDQRPWQSFPGVDDVAHALIREAKTAVDVGRGVFVVPGTVARPGSAKARDIIETGAVLLDLDEGDVEVARGHLARHLGAPSLEVASGGVTAEGQTRLHLYWRLSEAARGDDLALVARLRREIAEKVGGDGSFASLHQPIRVPGTIHAKHGVRNPVRLLACREIEHDLDELADAIAAMPALAGLQTKARGEVAACDMPSARDPGVHKVRAGGVDGITRFDALSRAIGHQVRAVRLGDCTTDDARLRTLDYNRTVLEPPFDDGKVHRDFEAILARDMAANGPPSGTATPTSGQPGGVVVAPPLSDDAIAAAFVGEHGANWRYMPVRGIWCHWDGKRWRTDERNQVRDLVRQTCRAASNAAESPQLARRIASQKTISAVLNLAMSDPAITARSEDWDAEPFCLNTPAGIVDLRTGEIGPHQPALMLSLMTTGRPAQSCARWLRFLDEITGGDSALQGYLRRLAGYCLTGSTKEQVFAFLHGQGANGKSVFLQVIAAVMGSYAMTAAPGTFMKRRGDRHLTELAGLKGSRLVIVAETEGGGAWDEERIKQVTGGEMIRANFMHRDHFEFRPEFKLIIAGNHRPALASTGEDMRRRLHLVPFVVTIPAERRDPDLLSKLLEERDGILGWMIEGCVEWQRSGIKPSTTMLEAASGYFSSEDLIGQWLAECCQVGSGQSATSRDLMASWKTWALSSGNEVGSQKGFGEALRARGFKPGHVQRSRAWVGLAPIDRQNVPGGAA